MSLRLYTIRPLHFEPQPFNEEAKSYVADIGYGYKYIVQQEIDWAKTTDTQVVYMNQWNLLLDSPDSIDYVKLTNKPTKLECLIEAQKRFEESVAVDFLCCFQE